MATVASTGAVGACHGGVATPDESAPRIHGEGTPEAAWQACDALWQRAPMPLPQLLGSAARLVVVAPHPDDEVLACGGLMALAAEAGVAVQVIAVTDGEACYPGEPWWTPERLAGARRLELHAALTALGVAEVFVRHLGMRDGAVEEHEADLTQVLAALLRADDLVLTPWRHDGHPDHEAVARATLGAAARVGARPLEYPVWAWHWLAPEQLPAQWPRPLLLDITHAAVAKQHAIRCFATQTGEVAHLHASPILPAHVLARFARHREVYLA